MINSLNQKVGGVNFIRDDLFSIVDLNNIGFSFLGENISFITNSSDFVSGFNGNTDFDSRGLFQFEPTSTMYSGGLQRVWVVDEVNFKRKEMF